MMHCNQTYGMRKPGSFSEFSLVRCQAFTEKRKPRLLQVVLQFNFGRKSSPGSSKV